MIRFPSRKDKIIMAAIDIIDKEGIHGLTAKELAEKGNMAQSLIYRYFTSMDDVVLAALDYFSRYDEEIFRSVKLKRMSPAEKILYYVKLHLINYESEPQVTSLANSYEALKHQQSAKAKMEEIIYRRVDHLENLIQTAKEAEQSSFAITPHELSVLIWSYINHTILDWRIQNYSFSLRSKIIEFLSKLNNLLK